MKEPRKKKESLRLEPKPFFTPPSPLEMRMGLGIGLMALVSAIVVSRGLNSGLAYFAGNALIAGILLYILYRDIKRYKPRYFAKERMLLLLALLMVFTLAATWGEEVALRGMVKGFQLGPDAENAVRFGVPAAAGAMLIILLFDFHAAIVTSFVMSLLIGLWAGDPAFTVYVIVGSLVAAFTVSSTRRRTAVIRSGFLVFLAEMGVACVMLLSEGRLIGAEALYAAVFCAISAVSVVAIVSLLLPLLENVFKVTTDISLLELLDVDHPLMKNLMVEAPGTYHHSIILGNLVEACAEVVSVNPLLARVGAYYHDIGKAKMPEYFIENQPLGVSKHEKLTAHMSSMILTSHVKEGVELARQYNLPEEVVDIIQQHHGTALITYFYEKAKEETGETPAEDVYRYPGPKPQTRTAALIMMADAVEAASRVLNDPTPARIAALVDKIINHIFLAGQLDECELTLKDISRIKDKFTYILTGVLHRRIDYPGFDFNKDGRTNGARKGEGNGKPHAGDEKPRQPQNGRESLQKGAQVTGD